MSPGSAFLKNKKKGWSLMKKRKIWIDCDPGIDDAFAISLAAACQDQLEILGISTVAGNQSIERVTENARKLTAFLGIPQVPVAQGSVCPLVREMISAAHVHGSTGLGDCCLPETEKKVVSENGILYLAKALLSLPEGEQVTLVPIGPLTNIALLFRTFPEVREKIEGICLMGGAAVGGNVTATGEFNIWEDPEAAQVVFSSGIPLVMCGLDVTGRCGLNREHAKQLLESKSPVQKALGEMVSFYLKSPAYQNKSQAAIHDAVTITYLLHPEWFEGKAMHVEVDCSEGKNRGMTVCDFRTSAEGDYPVTVLLDVEAERVQEF